MLPLGWSRFILPALSACWLVLSLGCEASNPHGSVGGYDPDAPRARRARAVAEQRLQQERAAATQPASAPALVEPAGPAEIPGPQQVEALYAEVIDPLELLEEARRELQRTDLEVLDRRVNEYIVRTLEPLARRTRVQLSLMEAVHRALRNNYSIQVESYQPAIESTRIVEAEAQFDAIYFANFSYNKQDRPSPSQLVGTESDTRVFTTGIRKLLSTGMQVQASYVLNRSQTNLSFQTLNPAYFNQFIVEFRQPFLRGFGLDFNRAQIKLAKIDRAISVERLRQQIRETVFNVEQAYWRLLQSRRLVAVSARFLAQLDSILFLLQQRQNVDFDVTTVQVNQTATRLQSGMAAFIELRNQMRNAEDTLKALLNDPNLNLAQDFEIIPTSTPSVEPVVLDVLGEIAAGLLYRSELLQAKLTIEQAMIAIGVAQNQALPRLDLLFRYIVDGLGPNADRAFSQLSENDFNEYELSLEFEWPIGNRGPEAALRRARLQQAQAIASHRAQIEQVILQVKQAIRELQSNYEQLGPQLRSARAAEDQLRATIARQIARDPSSLQVELDAHQQLQAARQQLLQSLIDYNVAFVNLERQKGTLLKYHNIQIRGEDDEAFLQPYKPLLP